MEPIEEKLKQAMSRVDAPAGFVERVMARVETQPSAAPKSFGQPCARWFEWLWNSFARPLPAGAAVLALLIALGLGVGHWRRQALPPFPEHERLAGQKASAQLRLALQIAGTRLSRMHALVSQPPPDGPTPAGNDSQPGLNQ